MDATVRRCRSPKRAPDEIEPDFFITEELRLCPECGNRALQFHDFVRVSRSLVSVLSANKGVGRLPCRESKHGEIKRFTRYGHYLYGVKFPTGSLPCNIDYLGQYAVVAALGGPDLHKGAPIFILENGKLISTIFPKDDLGLENFKHIHNAVRRELNGKYYIIAQSWNPAGFAVLEQVTD